MVTTRIIRAAPLPASGISIGRSGNTAVEFALVAPMLIMFLFGILKLGLALWYQNALDYSVAEAARCASDNPGTCGSSSQITSYAAATSGAGFASSVFTYTAPAAGNCGYQVTASYPMSLAIPYMNLNVTLTSSACYPN